MSQYDLTLKPFVYFVLFCGHFFNHFLSTGNMNEKIAPPSGLFSAKIFPPWASMIVLHIDSPRPIPVLFVVSPIKQLGPKIDRFRSRCYC
jgi:hypothetical protein